MIGLVTVTALIGLGGLGQLFIYGFNTLLHADHRRTGALGARWPRSVTSWVGVERLLVPWSRTRVGRRPDVLLAQVFGWFTTSASWTGFAGHPRSVLAPTLTLGWVVVAATAIGGGLGLVLGHTGRGALVAVNAANAFRAVPTLALLTLLAIYPPISLKWDGFLAPCSPSPCWPIPPILTNTYVGIREVDADVPDAARAMGLTGGQVLGRVEAPLAVPFVMRASGPPPSRSSPPPPWPPMSSTPTWARR